MDDELSLRDIANILGRYTALLIGLPLLLAALAFGALSLSARTFTSKTILALNNNTQNRDGADTLNLDPSLLPSAAALTSAYQGVAPRRLAGVWQTEGRDVQQAFEARYDEKSNAITLSAQAESPADAQRRVEQATEDFVRYANRVVTNVISEIYRSRLQQTRFDVQSDRLVLTNLRRSLAQTPQVLSGRGQSTGRANADAVGLDGRFAGNSDQPANPAYAYIAVKIAELDARLATNEALVTRLENSLRSPEQLLSLARQTTQLSTLAEANVPITPNGPGRGMVTLLAFLLGGLLAVLIAFVHHALRAPSPARPVQAATLQHGD
ncbi:hypothetical protein [Deinococcus peraridilitoris]|uniref:Chain length determinant protein n=1 Tax=Deinococcus peraridilitoris (strain DSM 19664 / LMG 22246 / CIP 109416 / KR-200) TaxID=937777 RepID=K9ZYZ1_DEIPD|nr:hypothetical protein [Deinococcus peraridilitoris]AFZ66424.1 hypothetical protein Deipe_0851 [Deinococcus peraridilitoris DSM 19664]